MSVCVIHPRACKKSATRLAEALKATTVNPFLEEKRNFLEYDVVINYGCALNVKAKKLINTGKAVEQCVSKTKSFAAFKAAGVPSVNTVLYAEEVPKNWKIIVCRTKEEGHSNAGMMMLHQGEKLPPSVFYSEYYKHKFEFRIVVLCGKVVARYNKEENKEGEWEFISLDKEGFDSIDKACLKAAKALGIDYVGFDVLANSQEDFVLLEANSGPILTDDVVAAMQKEIGNA